MKWLTTIALTNPSSLVVRLVGLNFSAKKNTTTKNKPKHFSAQQIRKFHSAFAFLKLVRFVRDGGKGRETSYKRGKKLGLVLVWALD